MTIDVKNPLSALPSLRPQESETSTKIITLNFRSYHPEEDEGREYPESDEKNLYVFTCPFFKGNNYALIEWDTKACGINLTEAAQDAIAYFNETEVENPWCAEVGPTFGLIKADPAILASYRTRLTEIFSTYSDSWRNADESKFAGHVIRESAVVS
jgi:hypothetical protein